MRLLRLTTACALLSLGHPRAQTLVSPARYAEYPDVLPGKVLKVSKTWDPGTGKIEVHLIQDGSELTTPIAQLEQQENAARMAKNGPFSDELADLLPSIGLSAKVRVSVHLKLPPIQWPNKTLVGWEEARNASIAAANLAPVVSLPVFLARHALLSVAPRGNDIAEGELTRSQIEELKGDADIGAIEVLHEEDPTSPEFSTLAASAYNPSPVPSSSGTGVNAATFETGLTSAFLSCIGVTPAAYDANASGDLWEIRHANGTFYCLAGVAPSANFYHRKSTTFDGTSDVNYLINNGIQTVSLSWSRGGTSPYHSTYSEFLVMDDFAYRYPYPVFLNPSGNSGYAYEANWQNYNAINVGNVRHTGNTTYELADCTQTKNPPPVYGSCISGTGASCAGDREMPYVVVPGIPYTGTDFASTCLGGAGTLNCGTSWSAAIANGVAADVIAADSRLSAWPEKVRATVILTAQNVDGGYWSSATDGRDGSGTVSVSAAVSFAQGHTSVSPGNTAVEKGLGAGSLYATDFGVGNKRFNYLVPNPKPSGKHLRAVLTWDSNPVVGGTTNALSDLDLVVQKNGGTQSSSSWDGNVEVVDVAAADLTAGSSYYIDVAPVINRIPASGSRTTYFYYSIAWAWVKDHAD